MNTRFQPQSTEFGALIAKLQSEDWHERSDAVVSLKDNPAALRSDEVRRALVGVLDRENKIIKTSLEENGGVANRPGFGEDYTEYYYGPLSETIDLIADPADSATLEVLARSSYNPDSAFAKKLAGYGDAVVPTMQQMAVSPRPEERRNALAVLGLVLEHELREPGGLRAENREQIRRTLEQATADYNFVVKLQAVRSLGAVGDAESLQVLGQVMRTEPQRVTAETGNQITNPIRTEARRAIREINSAGGRQFP
ncbi:MAG TPA: HEAT repeat domain-containing protein [Pyrinomonadaceae bacterium]